MFPFFPPFVKKEEVFFLFEKENLLLCQKLKSSKAQKLKKSSKAQKLKSSKAQKLKKLKSSKSPKSPKMPSRVPKDERRRFPLCFFVTGVGVLLVVIHTAHEYNGYYNKHSEVVKFSHHRLNTICSDSSEVEKGHWHNECHDASHDVKIDPSTYARGRLLESWGLGNFASILSKILTPSLVISSFIAILFLRKPAEWAFNAIRYTWGKSLLPD